MSHFCNVNRQLLFVKSSKSFLLSFFLLRHPVLNSLYTGKIRIWCKKTGLPVGLSHSVKAFPSKSGHGFGSRSSHRRFSVKKDVLRNLAKFTAKHLCQSLCQPQVCNFIKRETLAQVFSREFCEFFFYRTPLGECF